MSEGQTTRFYDDLHGERITNSTRLRIVEAATELFALNGYTGVSIRDITKAVGIKESSLYKHFKSKEELIETIFHNFRRACGEILPPMKHLQVVAETMDLKSFLETGWMNFKRHIDDPVNQRVWRIMYIELFRHPLARDIYQKDIVNRTIDCLELVFAAMIEAGKIKPNSPRLLAIEYQYPVFAMITEYLLLLSENKSTGIVEERITNHIAFFHHEAAG